jgi:hypothetical protein
LLVYMLSRYHRLVTASVAAFSSLTPAPCSPRCSDQAVLSAVSQLHHSPHQIHGTTNYVVCISLSDYSSKNV